MCKWAKWFKGWFFRHKGDKGEEAEKNHISIRLKSVWHKMRTNDAYQLKVNIMGIAVISIYLGSIITQIYMVGNNEMFRVYYNPFTALYVWIARITKTILPTLVIAAILFYIYIYLKKLFHKDYVEDKKRNIKIAKSGTYGSAHFMYETEKNNFLLMSKKPEKIKENILGIEEEGRIVARKPVRFTNRNVIIIAPPGGGKSVCSVNVNILQNIMRGDSFVAVDTKGALYRDTAFAAKAAGYEVRIFNTKPDEVEHSDGVDLIKHIKSDYSLKGRALAKGDVHAFVTGLMMNIKAPEGNNFVKKDIWYTGALNLLKSLILIVKYDEELPLKKRTIEAVYKIIVEYNTWDLLQSRFSYVEENIKHPAYESWRNFTGCRDVVKESIMGGLATDLSFLADDRIAKICSSDEIDMSAPGFKRCAYYIVIDDNNPANSMLAAMFIDNLCNELKNRADKQLGDEAALPVSVNLEIDEAANIGIIPALTNKMSTLRSRGVNFFLYYQDISQIQTQYPGEQWRTIVTDASTLLVLKVGNDSSSKGTAKYIEDRLGSQTVIVDNTRQRRTKTEIINAQNKYDGTEGMGTRPLMYASEIQGQGETGLQDNELIAIFNGAPPIILKKFNWWEHPLYKALNLGDSSRKMYTYKHKPKWAMEYFAEENKDQQAKQQMGMEEKMKTKETMPGRKSTLKTVQLVSSIKDKPMSLKEKVKAVDEQILLIPEKEGGKKTKSYEKKSNKL